MLNRNNIAQTRMRHNIPNIHIRYMNSIRQVDRTVRRTRTAHQRSCLTFD